MVTKDRSGYMTWKQGRTWFRVIGDLNSSRIPIVVLHGGPGSAHNNVLTIAKLLSATGRPVIVYDQFGYGKSTPLRSKPAELKGLIIADSLPSSRMWVRETRKLATIYECSRSGI